MLRPALRLPCWRRALAHLALAWLIVAQLMLGAVATAQHAGRAVAAQTGILCAGGTSDAPADAPIHDALCCVLGCAAASPMPLLGGTAQGFAAPVARVIATGFPALDAAAPPARAGLGFNATGPPARA